MTLTPIIRDAAWGCGYCTAVHGTMKKDLDVMAMPWIEMASSPAELAQTIAEAVGAVVGAPTQKPVGRIAYSLVFLDRRDDQAFVPWIDLSIMPPVRFLPPAPTAG